MRWLLILLVLSWFGAQAQDLDDIIKSERESYEARYDIKSKRSGQKYDIVYQHLKLKVDPDVRSISGSVACQIISKESSFNQFSIDLDDRMIVDSVKQGSSHLSFSQAADEIVINVNAQNAETLLDFEIFYGGDPTVNEQRAFNYDMHMTAAIAWSLSEPYGALGWWPNKQDLEDKIDSFDMSINVPNWAKAAGLGLLQNVDTLPDSTLTFHWKHRYPVAAYLVAVTVTNFYEESHFIHLVNGDSVYHLDYLYPEYKPAADTLRHDIDGMMRLFDSLFGPYPFIKEKYGHAQFARGGGMEHQTMSSMSDLRYTLMAHELAHQWYGNKITCDSWEDLWLNEGFATYLAGIAYEFLQPRSEFIEYMTTCRDRTVSQPDGSVFATDTVNVNVLFSGNMRYRKGAMVLHMLRWELGDSIFFQGVRNYTAAAGICYDFADTDDFKFYMEEASNQDLTGFFDRWIYGEGHPVLATFWTRRPGDVLELDIRQQTSDPSVEFYPLNIEYTASNDFRDTTFVVEHRTAQDIFTLDLGFRVEQITYDPNVWLAANHTLVEGDHVDLVNIAIYPNPTNQDISIFVKDQKLDRIEILDIQGKLLYQTDVLDLKNKIVDLDMNSYANGIYYIRIEFGDEFFVSKVIKSTY